jgi:hypothetical protein
MLNRLPRQVPPLSVMLDDIGRPSPRELARAFDVTERTVRRWIAHDEAPMTVLLALFWLTRWGISAADAEAHNAAVMSAATARALRTQVDDLLARLERMGRIADFGCANDPAPGVTLPPGTVEATGADRPEVRENTGTTERMNGGETQQPCGLTAS